MDRLQTAVAPLVGRLLMSVVFILSGFGKAADPAGSIGYIAHVGLPVPTLAYGVATILELGGGLLLLVGLFSRSVALALGVFCLVTAFAVHGFGDMNNMIHALKNIAMCGGFLYVASYGAGAWSIDAALSARRPRLQTA